MSSERPTSVQNALVDPQQAESVCHAQRDARAFHRRPDIDNPPRQAPSELLAHCCRLAFTIVPFEITIVPFDRSGHGVGSALPCVTIGVGMPFRHWFLGAILLFGAAFEPAVAGPDMIAEGTEPLRQGANPRGQHDEAPNVASQCGDPEIDWGMFKSYFDVIRQSIEHKRYDYAGRPQEGCVLTMLVEARRWAQAGGLLVRMYDRDRVEVGLSPSDWTPDFNARGWSPGERARVVVPLEPGPTQGGEVVLLVLEYR